MIVTFIYRNDMTELILPKKVEGIFNLETESIKDLISIEALDDYWIIEKSKYYRLLDQDEKELPKIILNPNTIYYIEIKDEVGLIYVEEDSDLRKVFTKYCLDSDIDITIGRDKNNIIQYNNKYIGRQHAELSYHKQKWTIKDLDSMNGSFVNNELITNQELNYGDIIYILGLKIIVFKDFIMVNNPNNEVEIEKNIFGEMNTLMQAITDNKDNNFYRSPRLKRDIQQYELIIDSPPERKENSKNPLVLTLGPSVTTGLATLVFATFNPMLSIISLACTIIWPIIMKIYEKHNNKKYETLRQTKYLEYLNHIEELIAEEKNKQTSILKENFVSLKVLEDRILTKDRSLWERGLFQDDFLKLRIGMGDEPLSISKKYAEKKFSLVNDDLKDKLDEIGKKEEILNNVPVSISFYDHYISGVIGDENLVKKFAQNLIIEASALYSYDEVKFIVIYDDKDFEFTKWLPHTISNELDFRFIATNQDELKEISYYLSENIQNRIENKDKKEEIIPYYIVFNLNKDLSLKAEFINTLYQQHTNLNFSIINFYHSIEELPKECNVIIELNHDYSRLLSKNESSYDVKNFIFNEELTTNPLVLAQKMANIKLVQKDTNFELPKSLSILDMYKVGKIEKLNIINRYQENDVTKSLKAPIGVDKYGNAFYLDLHEKFHGPHGLVAGTTGSGKSEFIMTYILSLAINYSPEEVSFILIDYKGGGMAKSFELLPHIAGIITNIDKSAVNRAIISIHSELKRREKMMASAKEIVGESNIDIYKYQKYYREGKLHEPLSHLFIISDEFAELKNQEPEFMDELISTARIGRSLGVHLILATQKPSGVVSDQIWSNSKFRVCLKVQDVADSQEMLKRPEAASIKDVGRFYLQVGNNELFELGQSAYGGFDYYPKNRIEIDNDTCVEIVNNNLLSLSSVKLSHNDYKSEGKQLDVLVKYISSICKQNKLSSRKIWQDIMQNDIILDEIRKKYPIQETKYYINPLIGIYDDLESQENKPLRISITDVGNLLVYGSISSDKTRLLTTFLYACMTSYSNAELNTYVLDFDSETLLMFQNLPTIADVILKDDEEKVETLFKALKKEIDLRKKIISKDFLNYKELINHKDSKKLPNIIVIINNYVAFKELYEDYEDTITYLTREGSKYGIYFIITLSLDNEIRYSLSQNFAQNISLQFYDEANYYSIVGKTDLIPAPLDGRGLVKINKNIYEYQTAIIVKDGNISEYIKTVGNQLVQKDDYKINTLIKTLPKNIKSDFLKQYKQDNLIIPIGINKETLNPSYLDIENNFISIVSATYKKDYLKFKKNIVNFINKVYNIDMDFIDSNSTKEDIDEIFKETVKRNNEYKIALKEKKVYHKPSKKIIIIDDLKILFQNIDKEQKDELEAILEKGNVEYNLYVVIFEEMNTINIMQGRSWFKNINRDNLLWIGSDFDDQYLFEYDNNFNSRLTLNNDYGILVKRRDVEIVKLLMEDDSNE